MNSNISSLLGCALALFIGCGTGRVAAADPATPEVRRLIQLGPGDSISLQVYGQPSMSSTVYVAEDGTIRVPLAGPVQVGGLSAVEAGQRVEKALREGAFLNDPHVTIGVVESHSQRVSVLGEVRVPGRYPVDPNSTIFELLAQAGGPSETSADYVYLMRPDGNGGTTRLTINLKGFNDQGNALPTQILRGGDEVYVPKAEQFYIYGAVNAPSMYRVERGMTVIEAIARAGGINPRGSERRVQIKRLGANNKYVVVHAKPGDAVKADDVIKVGESIF